MGTIHQNSVFWSNNHTLEFLDGLPKDVVGYKRWDNDNTYFIIINLSNNFKELDRGLLSGNLLMKDENSSSHFIAVNGYLVYEASN